MPITTLSSRQFNQDASKAKRAALAGPVIITDRGRPAHVLLTFEPGLTDNGRTQVANQDHRHLAASHLWIAAYPKAPIAA